MAHSLEARVPFFDVDYVNTVMNVNPEDKLCGGVKDGKCEKYMLRKMYEDDIPKEVVWRTKAMQCEGVGMTWVQTLQGYINAQISDEEFEARETTYPVNPPHTKEELYYRKVFEKYYPGCQKFIHVWPNGCRAGGAPWKNQAYSREGLKDVNRLKIGHGLASDICV
eukprot:CAMPEP_0184320364 /NCGR_PEP_ID=MMETSP1049-20130417/113635_1 /TAXON_ID=77928 /ORGANISM="Proteomonas sulcata, Strain CCMP704" /LENGTH=165 /DNA_ID=CAMNT_0026640843 /DNA_START=199 /DNA_END=696 /DNA_ORIENTATION=-